MLAETFAPEAPAAPTAAGRLQELGLQLDPGVRYHVESVFPKIAGWGWKGAVRKKHALIARVEPVLRRALAANETVLYVAKGVQHSYLESYFMGIWANTVNQTVFVLTNVRVLMLRTNSNGTPKETFWSLYYSQIDLLRPSWAGMVDLRLRDGRKLKFTGFQKADCKAMPVLFQQALDNFRRHGFDPRVTQSMENLCSHCFNRVPKDEYACGQCGAEFWTPMSVAVRSLIFPSWGDLCMKHYVLGIAELGGFAFAWMIAVGAIITGLNKGDWSEGVFLAGTLLVFTHGGDAVLTYLVAKKGLHPRGRGAADGLLTTKPVTA